MDKPQGVQSDLCSTTQALELIQPYSALGSLASGFKGNMKMEAESDLNQLNNLIVKNKNRILPFLESQTTVGLH